MLPYTFSIIRYVHDVVAGEFINVGVIVHLPTENRVFARCSKRYGRLSRLYSGFDHEHFLSLMRHLERNINAIGSPPFEIDLEGKLNINSVLKLVLQVDDSSIQFSDLSGGITETPEQTIEELFERFVTWGVKRRAETILSLRQTIQQETALGLPKGGKHPAQEYGETRTDPRG